MKKAVLIALHILIYQVAIGQPPPWAQFKDGKFHYYCWKDSAEVTFDGFNGYTSSNFFLNIDSSKVEKYEGKKSFGISSHGTDSRYNGKKWALVYADCKQLTPYIYDLIFPMKPFNSIEDIYFQPILFLACKEGKWGAINCNGKELVPCDYELPFVNTKLEQCFYFPTIDSTLECDLTKKLSCSNRMMKDGIFSYPLMGNNMVFIKNRKYGVVDTLGGKIIIDFVNDAIMFKKNGFYEAKKGKKTTTYTANGVILPYDSIFPSSTIYHRVMKNNKYGLIDESGNIFVPCKYDTLSDLKYDSYFDEYNGEAELKGKEIDIKINKKGEISFTE